MEASSPELDRWMARLADGDRSAFEPLYAALYPRAHRLARWRVGDSAAADVAQEALLRVFSRASEFEAGRPVLPWFYAIVANEVRAVLRSPQRRRTELRADPDADAVEATDPEQELLERELHQALEQALASLDAPSAEALGALLGRSARPAVEPATFRKRVSRAYVRLRALLQGEPDAS